MHKRKLQCLVDYIEHLRYYYYKTQNLKFKYIDKIIGIFMFKQINIHCLLYSVFELIFKVYLITDVKIVIYII